MRRTTNALPGLALIAAMLAVPCASFAQSSAPPTGHWQSLGQITYSNPFLAGDEIHLSIDVANDGTFSGTWREYFCGAGIANMGVTVIRCNSSLGDRRGKVTGKLGPDNRGVIDLTGLGRSALTWKAPAPGELAIDLPEYWLSKDEGVLYRARMNRDGKSKEASVPANPLHTKDDPPLSAVALYRSFIQNENAAAARYVGSTQVLEGRRGTKIELSSGGVAVHIPDGFTMPALVLVFEDVRAVDGIETGEKFRFSCRLQKFEYRYLHMENCTVVR